MDITVLLKRKVFLVDLKELKLYKFKIIKKASSIDAFIFIVESFIIFIS